jgi:PAS domain S-box-containing protein
MDKRSTRIPFSGRLTRNARAAGGAAIVIGFLVLLGWVLDVGLFKSVFEGKIAMKPNTAICFALIGAALVLLGHAPAQQSLASASRRRAAFVLATVVAVIGLATLSEILFGINLGIDNLLFRNSLLAKADSGRMAAAAALSFILLGVALLSLDAKHRIARVGVDLSALATLLLGAIALLGYLYQVEWLYRLLPFTPMALHTAFLFALLGLGVLLSRPERGMMGVLISEHGGGVMARHILAVAVLLPVALGWLHLKAEQAGLFGDRLSLALLVTSIITLLGVWIWLVARSLNVSDADKEQALEALQLSEERLRLALDAARLGTFDWDLSNNRITWSRWHEEMWGVKPGEFGGTYEAFSERVHADDLPGVNAEVARCIAARERFACEFRVVWPDGSVHWIASHGRFEFRADGQPRRMRGAVIEITERKRVEEQLRLQSVALESAANAIMITDPNGKIIWVNPAFAQTTGYSFEEAVGKSPRLLKSGKQDPAFYDEMWKSILSGKVWHNTIINRCKDGSLSHEDLTITPIRNKVGKITNFVGIKQDITEKTRAQEALRASEVRYRRLFESAKDGILILDEDNGQIVDANPYLVELLDYSKEELLGKELWEIGIFKDVIASKGAFVELQEQTYIRYEDLPLKTRRGVVRQVEFVSNSYLANGHRVIQCNIRDITERKQAEEELTAANQRLEQTLAELQAKRDELTGMTQQLWQASKLATMGELAASIAHELNNPLATVGLRTETLLMEMPADPDKRKPLEIIAQEVDRMANLVNNLLQFSRRSHRQISTVDPREEIATSVEFVQYHFRSHNIEVVREFADGLPSIHADRQQLRQLFLNLLTNASDAMPQGGKLIVRTAASRRGETPAVAIEFADSGEGIAAENMEKIWDSFFTTKPEGKGTGLGLAICRRIVEEHDGTIDIQSEGVGRGTMVRIVLPATTHGAVH